MATSLFEINGIQLDLDLLDADVLEKYESLTKEIQQKVNDPATYEGLEKEADKMRKQCRLVDEFFNRMFGEGTANAVFGINNNLGKRLDGFGALMEFANSSKGRITEITNKYNPQRIQNREQRRAAQFRNVGGNNNGNGNRRRS